MNKLESKIRILQTNISEATAKKQIAEQEIKELEKELKYLGIDPSKLEYEKGILDKKISKLKTKLEERVNDAETIIEKNK